MAAADSSLAGSSQAIAGKGERGVGLSDARHVGKKAEETVRPNSRVEKAEKIGSAERVPAQFRYEPPAAS